MCQARDVQLILLCAGFWPCRLMCATRATRGFLILMSSFIFYPYSNHGHIILYKAIQCDHWLQGYLMDVSLYANYFITKYVQIELAFLSGRLDPKTSWNYQNILLRLNNRLLAMANSSCKKYLGFKYGSSRTAADFPNSSGFQSSGQLSSFNRKTIQLYTDIKK